MSTASRHHPTTRARIGLAEGCIRHIARRPGRSGSALRLALVALAVDGSAVAHAADPEEIPSPPPNHAPEAGGTTPTRERFAEWVARGAAKLDGEIAELTEIELDGAAGGELVARVCHQRGWVETVFVASGRQRWTVAHPSWGHAPVCDDALRAGSWGGGADELHLVDWGPGVGAERRLAIIDGALVVLSQWNADHEAITEARWDLASHRRDGARGRVVPVRQGNRVPPESGPSFTLEGETSWHGREDAELRAVAERRPDGKLLLRVALRDDEPRLGPAGDGIDVWWQHGQTDELAGVRVRSDEIGRLQVATVRHDDALEVHGEVHAFELVLPWTVAAAEPFAVPFTVVARDVDEGGRTRLATSELAGSVRSLGLLRWVPGGGDFEPIGERITDASAFDDLPEPPRRAGRETLLPPS